MIEIRGLTKRFGSETVFDCLDLDIETTGITCIMGPSGCGKTTLLNILAGLTRYGGIVTGVPERIGYVFQSSSLMPHKTLLDNSLFVGADREYAEHLFELTELKDVMNKYPNRVSGGQRQRASIVRAIACRPELILMDEPFSSVDRDLKLRIMERLRRELDETTTPCIFVTHDREEAEVFGERLLNLGLISR